MRGINLHFNYLLTRLYGFVCARVDSNCRTRCSPNRRRTTVPYTSVERSKTSARLSTRSVVSLARWCSCSRHAGGTSGLLSLTGNTYGPYRTVPYLVGNAPGYLAADWVLVSGLTLNFQKSQDWTKIPKLYRKHEKTMRMRTILHSHI